MANPFVHVELHTKDPEKAKKFYTGLLSWKLEDMPMGENTYTMIQVGEGTGGGIMKNPAPGAPSHWLAYILVDDLAASTKQAEKLGGKVVQPITEVPEMGAFSVIADPDGAVFGLWEPKT
ncbi:MAG TPA: VOC family protein [Vicinamibacteria bacterium]|nr:VOC family protein [Vicinamibacteria bacterium]